MTSSLSSIPIPSIPIPSAPSYDVTPWAELASRFAWIARMAGTRQDPIHHAEGDVAIHTAMVCRAMSELPAFRAAPHVDRMAAFLSALLHDVAKPDCTVVGDDGRVTSKGHSVRGAIAARRILYELDAPFAVREQVAALVRHHQAPFWLLEKDDPFRLVATISQTARCDLLALLAESDARGRTCSDQARILDNVALFAEYCREHGCTTAPLAFPSDHTRFLYFGNRQSDPAHRAHEDFRCEVTVMSGLPGAGKDRWVRDHRPDVPVVSLDRLRHELAVDPEDEQGAVVQAAREEARAHLRAGRSFVWNATNVSRRLRAIATRLFADYGARIHVVYVEADLATLRAQNRSRPKPVPDHVIDTLLEKWEVPDLTEAHEVSYVIRSAASAT